jgi:hypothetical protein
MKRVGRTKKTLLQQHTTTMGGGDDMHGCPVRHRNSSTSQSDGMRAPPPQTQNGNGVKEEKKAHSNSNSHSVAVVSTLLQRKVVTISLSLRSIIIIGLCAFLGFSVLPETAVMLDTDPLAMIIPKTMPSFASTSSSGTAKSSKNSTQPHIIVPQIQCTYGTMVAYMNRLRTIFIYFRRKFRRKTANCHRYYKRERAFWFFASWNSSIFF